MTLDILEAFEALRRHDIRVARARYVDSAEDALAFAERRDAADPRFLPIVLRIARRPIDGIEAPRVLGDPDAVRQEFYALRVDRSGRILAQSATPPGTDVVMRGTTARGHKHIVIDGEIHGLPNSERAMIAHLQQRVMALFEDPHLTSLMIKIRLHENGYTVVDAHMTSKSHFTIKARAQRHARDRKGHYHSSGLQ